MSARNVKTCRPTWCRLHRNGCTPLTTTPLIDLPAFSKRGLRLSVSEGFDDEIVAILGSAFEAAWQSLQLSDSRLTHEPHIAYTRELLAKWILVLGEQGERDRNRLVEKALAFFAESNPEARDSLHSGKFGPERLPRAKSSSLRGTNSRHFSSMSDRRKSS
jgi:hypothetical protein